MHTILTWGDWLSAALSWLEPIVITAAGLAVTALAGRVGGPLAGLASSQVLDKLIAEAIDFGFGAINGAVKGKTLDVTTNNAILNAATSYVVAKAPELAAKYADTLRAHLFSKLSAAGSVPANSTALDHAVVLPLPKK